MDSSPSLPSRGGERLESIDSIRGLASFVVLFYHTFVNYGFNRLDHTPAGAAAVRTLTRLPLRFL